MCFLWLTILSKSDDERPERDSSLDGHLGWIRSAADRVADDIILIADYINEGQQRPSSLRNSVDAYPDLFFPTLHAGSRLCLLVRPDLTEGPVSE